MSALPGRASRKQRRLRAGVVLALLVPVALLTVGAASAQGTTNRFALIAQGDAVFYEVTSRNVPSSPQNQGGSLTARADVNSAGNSTAFAGAPYLGVTLTTLPGTISGALGQSLPVTTLPGYVDSRFPSERRESVEAGALRLSAESGEFESKGSGATGGPSGSGGPAQQQSADASVKAKPDGTVTAVASSSVNGVVIGPITGLSVKADATITENGNRRPSVSSSVSGTFNVAGYQVVFDGRGFRAVGQDLPAPDALAAVNDVLVNAKTRIAAVEESNEQNPDSGQTTYTLVGLRVTTVQIVPQAENIKVVYDFARVQVGSVSVRSSEHGRASAPVAPDRPDRSSSNGSGSAHVADSGIDTPTVSPRRPDVGSAPNIGGGTGGVGSAGDQEVAPGDAPLVLGAVSTPAPPLRAESELIYLVLVLAGVGTFVGSQLFSRFGVLLQLRQVGTGRVT